MLPHHSQIKLGKASAKVDPRTLKLGKYFTSALSPVLPAVDNTGGVSSWGMMLNDTLGCCTIAGCGHAEQVWSIARGNASTEDTLPDAAILQKYELWCGYNPGAPLVDGQNPTDQGGIEVDVLNKWRQNPGFWRHYLLGYADPATNNLEHICKAIELFGGVYIGVQLPITAQNQTTWDVTNDGDNSLAGSWGGHCVFVPKYRTENGKIIFTCISWGELIDITQDFWLYTDAQGNAYLDEVHALIAPEFLNIKTGKSPEGLDLTTLESDLNLVTN